MPTFEAAWHPCWMTARQAVSEHLALFILPNTAASEPTQANPKAPPGRTALYRHYDADDRLLYVGITCNPESRGRDHRKTASRALWLDQAVRFTGVWYPTRAAAEEAERMAIRREHPLYNRQRYSAAHVPALRRHPGRRIRPEDVLDWRLTVRLPVEMLNQIKARSDEAGVNFSAMFRQLLEFGLEHMPAGEAAADEG